MQWKMKSKHKQRERERVKRVNEEVAAPSFITDKMIVNVFLAKQMRLTKNIYCLDA